MTMELLFRIYHIDSDYSLALASLLLNSSIDTFGLNLVAYDLRYVVVCVQTSRQ